MSHRLPELPKGGLVSSVAGWKSHIKSITEHEPMTCPWRTLSDPLVYDIVGISSLCANHMDRLAIPEDPPAIYVDAMRVYLSAKACAQAHDAELERRHREAESKRPK